jgi:aquaporin rerated protein, other eukaryote
MFLTTLLVLTILMLAVEKHKATYIAPVGIGLALFICHLAGIYFTGASMNPARSFGPQVVIGNFPGYHWIYCISTFDYLLTKGLGPSLGAMLAAAIFKILKLLEYELNNGDQDRDDTMLIARIVENKGDLKKGQVIVAEIGGASGHAGGGEIYSNA